MIFRRATVAAVLLVGVIAPTVAQAHRAGPPASYATADFKIRTNSYAFGQAPVFLPDGRVLFGKNFGTGDGIDVYRTNRDGSDRKCLTCELGSRSNNVPVPRPQGDWILFHSWLNHSITIGSAGYGGVGSELYAMRSDGSHVTKIFGLKEPANGEGTDDYHAYWSPDGKRIVWAHLNANFISGGGDVRWDVRVANFVVRHGTPHLTHIRVVRPANGHWYETQWWAPDGKGFLYTESFGTAENTELFWCHLPKHGMCRPERLTNNVGWDEQAIFTPDMKDVLFMSSRDYPGFYNSFTTIAADLGLPNVMDNFLILPIFEGGFLQPVAQERTDLYDLNLKTRAVRRLTHDGDDGWITPEFTWDPSNKELWWTENRFPPGEAVPFPLNAGKQLHDTIAFLQHPDINFGAITDFGTLPIKPQQRTRVAYFKGVS